MDRIGGHAKSLVYQKLMSTDGSHAIQSSKGFAKLASDLISSTTVLHIDQQEIDEEVALADSWEDTQAVVGTCKIHDAKCIFRDGKIEFHM